MAKISFTKLGLKINKEIKVVNWNDQEIEVKQYLPANEKLDMISRIINMSADDMKFYNVGKLEIFMTLELIYEYSNISFTDKQKEDVCKLYDALVSSGLCKTIMDVIPNEEIEWINSVLMDTINSIYDYQNSAMGILDSITQDYTNLDLEASTIQQKLADPGNLELLKGIMTRLG